MPDPFTMAIGGYVAAHTHEWLKDLKSTLLDKGKEQGKAWLNEKEQERLLQQLLAKAVKQGLAKFRKQQERDQYKDILQNLFEPGEHSEAMRREAMALFTLSDTPDLTALNEIYNRSLRIRHLSQPIPPAEVDAARYLTSFFDALIAELYSNDRFRSQISDALQARMAMVMPQQMTEANTTLRQIHQAIKDDYTEEQFQRDMATYTTHVERILHNLKIIGFLPKEQNRDPELNGIFVPLRIALTDDTARADKQHHSLLELLERYHYIVLLGDPGSGKSTVVRHLAWSHAYANMTSSEQAQAIPLLSRCPLPLRIELRLFTQSRKHHPDHSFLSYATGVLLKQENITINPLMFERLLAEKRMLILFDGLDEVTTLDERQRLVQEIEHFAQHYPGNHILVTSRPAGYELACCSKQLFTHAQVQKFDDDQIHQFLERWYEFVLRLNPLPYEEQQELETLFAILKENTRLHKLAENPLLLTVITALYRSQRLPEKRVQVYDKCAELLLETWANIKGTNARWSEMKLGRDDQFACVAHLGFKLHQRSQDESTMQEQNRPGSEGDTATDVPARLLLREIESFLDDRKLISEKAERRKEAERFMELMRIEAGLIVDRGTDENGESIYGFVHRTFQEYFAAADVYERYRQDEDPEIIKDFLVEHLHDPHWQEVILLLLGKLGRKPVTLRLREILNGSIKSRRSHYTDLVQQDLFFVCDCLIEELPVENDLAESAIARLSDLILTSPFPSQRTNAVEKLGRLMQTKQCSDMASKELVRLVKLDTMMDIELKIRIAGALYKWSERDSEEEQEAKQILVELIHRGDISVEQAISAAEVLYEWSERDSEEEQEAKQILMELVHRKDISAEQVAQAAHALYNSSLEGSEEKRQAVQVLLNLTQRTNGPVEQLAPIALFALKDSSERQQIVKVLIDLVRSGKDSIENIIQAIIMLDIISIRYPNVESQVIEALMYLIEHMDIQITTFIASLLSMLRLDKSRLQQQVVHVLKNLIHHVDVPIEQVVEAAEALYGVSPENSKERQQALQMLKELICREDIPKKQVIQVAKALYRVSPEDSEEKLQAIRVWIDMTLHEDIAVEQAIEAVETFYTCSAKSSEERQQALLMLWQLTQDERVTADQRLHVLTIPVACWHSSYLDKTQTLERLFALLPKDQIMDYVEKHWPLDYDIIAAQPPDEIPYAVAIAQQQLLPLRARDHAYASLSNSVPQFDKIPSPDVTIAL
ncbi:MAG TPA: NACHT domain-containing protein [Ktedonobacteraceae bacterium]|nr:NACHT domain-containing protein [Ktedonobacteraceae bacterium]